MTRLSQLEILEENQQFCIILQKPPRFLFLFAHHLFQGLLFFNNAPVDKIIAEGTDNRGLGLAIMNRLTKASGFHVIEL
ncbi:MAG: Sua5 family C-terminal domain-containing protein [Dialister sp.]|nr:Sua5 family C-terminal domain-containing protein [Dialister sp.]